LVPLQKVTGEEAVGFTQEEMGVLFGKLKRDIELDAGPEDSDTFTAAFPLGYVVYSLDKATQHLAILRSLPDRQKNEPPAHSPDIHKVIEHPLSPFNAAWYKEFTLDTKCTSARTAMDKASEILHRTKADSIWKDIQTLPDTLRSVLHNGGDWADHGLC
jgi:nitrate reductase alpha subunit